MSSDGDPRLLSAMRSKVEFCFIELTENELESCTAQVTQWIFAQDTTHVGTKLRNRLLKAALLMPMGFQLVSNAHLKTLIKTAPKDVHLLVNSDICPKDRQNYGSLEKIMSTPVIEALEKYVVGSEATVMYLRLCKQITSSFLDEQLNPSERIYNIWHAVYFFRAWRKWLLSKRNSFRLDENFITTNAYQCIEINAHSLIYSILKLRLINKSHLFQTVHFASQPCELIFRHLRSLGTPNFTKINFNLYELLHMVSRVELMNTISNKHSEKIFFPRNEKKVNRCELPSNNDILIVLMKARDDALENAKIFGMIFSPLDVASCELDNRLIEINTSELDDEDDEDDEDVNEDDDPNDDHNSRFVQVPNNDGSMMNIGKSRLVWLLTESTEKLSSDRLKRVQTNENISRSKRRKANENADENVETVKQIEIGQWYIFKTISNTANSTEIFEKVVFGAVVGFKYLEIPTQGSKPSTSKQSRPKNRAFDSDIAEVNSGSNIMVLGSWHYCDNNGTFRLVQPENCFFIPIANYVAGTEVPKCTIDPSTKLKTMTFQGNISNIKEELRKLLA